MVNSAPKATLVINGSEEIVYIKTRSQLASVLKKFDILPESVLAVRDGDLIPEDTVIHDGDVINIINIISGG